MTARLTDSDPRDCPDDIFVSVLARVALAALGMAATIAFVQVIWWPAWVSASLAVAFASGTISVAAVIPGIFLQRFSDPRIPASIILLQAVIWAMAIRVVGTVALTALCHYHMGPSVQTIAFLIVVYYVVLTSAEVSWIAGRARGIRDEARSTEMTGQGVAPRSETASPN